MGFLHPAPVTICYYITHPTTYFNSAKSIRNYISEVQFLHKQLRLTCECFDTFPNNTSLLTVANLTMRTLPLPHFPIPIHLLPQLCLLSLSLGPLSLAMKVCPASKCFAMLKQSKLAPAPVHQFNPSWNAFRGDILVVPPGLVLKFR